MLQKGSIFLLVTSWVLYSVVFSIVATLQVFILPMGNEGLFVLDLFLLVDLGRLLLKSLLLSATGFIVYGFIRYGLGYLTWFKRETRGYVTRVVVYYLVITLSMLVTHLIAFDRLPIGILVDIPILNAIVVLMQGSIPYFKNTLFSAQD